MREIKKKMSYRHLDLEESGCDSLLISMCGDLLDSVEWCIYCISGDSRSLMEIADWSQC